MQSYLVSTELFGDFGCFYMFAVLWQEFYEFMSNVSGIPNYSIINTIAVADSFICEVSLT